MSFEFFFSFFFFFPHATRKEKSSPRQGSALPFQLSPLFLSLISLSHLSPFESPLLVTHQALNAPSKCPVKTKTPSAEKQAEWHAEPHSSDCEQKPRRRSQTFTARSLPAERATLGSAGEAEQQVTLPAWPVRVWRTLPEPSIEEEVGENDIVEYEYEEETFTSHSLSARSSPPASSPRPSQVKARQVTVSSMPWREPTQPTEELVALLPLLLLFKPPSLLPRLPRPPPAATPPTAAASEEGSQRRTTRSAPAVASALPVFVGGGIVLEWCFFPFSKE